MMIAKNINRGAETNGWILAGDEFPPEEGFYFVVCEGLLNGEHYWKHASMEWYCGDGKWSKDFKSFGSDYFKILAWRFIPDFGSVIGLEGR